MKIYLKVQSQVNLSPSQVNLSPSQVNLSPSQKNVRTPIIGNEYLTKRHIIPINLSRELNFDTWSLHNYFIHCANIISSNSSSNKTVISFERDKDSIGLKEWRKKSEIIYIFTIDNKIVKIGGSRVGIAGRISSYLCGHHIYERSGNDKCSITNARVYNTFDYYLQEGHVIDMYVYILEDTISTQNIFGRDYDIYVQTYHAYESVALDIYKRENGKFPKLSDNSDPSYKVI